MTESRDVPPVQLRTGSVQGGPRDAGRQRDGCGDALEREERQGWDWGIPQCLSPPRSHHGLLLQLGLRRGLDREH